MSELKAIKGKAIHEDIEYYARGFEPGEVDDKINSLLNTEYYLKSEADEEIAELKKEIESMNVKFRKFNDNVCKKIVDASRTMSAISQDAQMDFYEEFIKG